MLGPTLLVVTLLFHYPDFSFATLQTHHQFIGSSALELCQNAKIRLNDIQTIGNIEVVHADCVVP